MRQELERELKLQAPEGFALPELGGEDLEPRVFVSTYHDTTDHRLAKSGVTLRHRVENGRGLWQLKLPRTRARLELELAGGPVDTPRKLLALLPAITRGKPLAPVARLRTRRAGVRVRDDERTLADVVFDSVSVMEGQRVTRTFEELEVELVDGDERSLKLLAKTLVRAGAKPSDGQPKLFQALGLRTNGAARPEPKTTAEALRAMFALQLDRMLAHDPGVRLGSDPEDLHQLRVATRRLRAFLRVGRAVLEPEWAEGLRLELRWLGAELGPVRDLDVLLGYLHEEAAALDERERASAETLFKALKRERSEARTAMLAALKSDRYIDLLDRLETAAAAPPAVGPDVPLGEVWRREFKRLQKAVAGLGDEPADEALHETRIKAKRARYAAELAAPALGKRGARFVEAAKTLQDSLGEHNDSAVAEERIRALARASRAPAAHFAAGRLVERQRARRRGALAEFPHAWAELDRRGRSAAKS